MPNKSLMVVKRCSCGTAFTLDDLLHLRALKPIGMQQTEGRPAIYCFTHMRPCCRTTFGLPVETFRDHIEEPLPARMATGTDACQGHCAELESLETCGADCSLAPYRRFLLERLKPRK